MKKLKELLSNKQAIILLLFVLGILIVIFSYIIPKPHNNDIDAFSETEYVVYLEERVKKIISSIDGVGECDVMINVNSTVESVYVKENKKSYDNDENKSKGEQENSVLTMIDENGNQTALMKKQVMPSISGVVIVCDGGNSVYIQTAIIDAVSTLLDISSSKVCVIKKT